MFRIDKRVEAVCLEAWRLLPPIKVAAVISRIEVADLGGKHGSYSPDDGVLTLSSRLFWGDNVHQMMHIDYEGNCPAISEPYCSRALHTVIHEYIHAIGEATGTDTTPRWLALSGWEQTWKDGQGTGRYYERRPGWGEQGGSPWRYRKGSWFCREYSSKSPREDYADCGTHIALGWHLLVHEKNGKAKMRYMLREVWGVEPESHIEAVTAAWRERWGEPVLGER